MTKLDVWQTVLEIVEKKVNQQSFNTWFKPTQLIKYDDKALYVRVPNAFFQDWLNDHIDVVVDAARQAELGDINVIYITEKIPVEVAASSQGRLDFDSVDNTLNPKYTFDTFVVGSSNQFAHAAALAVAERPSKAYNPLFLYGGVGLGKTHLMHAIGHTIKLNNKTLRLTYISTEKFTNEVINAIRYDKMLSFKERYRNNDVLLIDDIQFIAGKERTQEEFFHTFNSLYDTHKQIIISADCPPREIPTIEERLHSRFEWGLIADIQPPDLETKVAIIKKKAERQNISIPDNVALYIASKIKSNIRELEGALVRLIAFCSLKGSEITLVMAQETLHDILGPGEKTITIEMIQKMIADHFKMRVHDLKSKNNSKSVAEPRQICMYLCKQLTGASLPQIGREFGNKHHTTVLHSVNKIEELRQQDRELNKQIQVFLDSFK
ncbi:MAG TPA: chromosomal replication initiator protein DnaA [Terriglobia bacterium]|jgi:chromosomal replication initiator protein|nr:chromosomal replication initiator protein DnaA [Terriglobia bacterium]